MLLSSEMSRVYILTHERYRDELIEKIHEAGLMEISHSTLPEVEEGEMHPDVGKCASYELRLTKIIDVLKKYEKKKKGIKSILSPVPIEKKRVKKQSLEEKIEEADALLQEVEKSVMESEAEIEEIEKKFDIINEKIEKAEILSNFDIDISWLGTSPYLFIKAGISNDINALRSSLNGMEVEIFSKEVGRGKEKKWAVLIVSHSSLQEKIERKIKNFEEIEIKAEGTPLSLLKKLKEERKELESKKENLIEELRKIFKKRKRELFAIREEIHIEKERKEIQEKFGKTKYTFLIEGWCLTEKVKELRDIVNETTKKNALFSFVKAKRNPDEPPIHIKMPWWAKSFQTFLELFSLPKYNEINPSIFLGISFIIFFAVMLGDAGYGILIFALSLFAYLKWGKHSEMIKNWSFLGICLGFATTITGLLFNSFFGDLIPRFIYGNENKMLYTLHIMGYTLPIDALHKPLVILVLALLIGLVHLNLGFILAIYQNYKRGHTKDIFKEQIPWFLLQIGGGALVGNALLHVWELSTFMLVVCGIFTAIGLIALFVNKGPIGFFELTGFVGDWLSYARLLALGLATAGMALAFNIVAQLMPKIVPYVGIILLPIILVVAHIANLLIQSLGAAIHALRLQYVEFFNRFYEGGGRKFVPFRVERKYTEEIK
ncbi:MAG: V-type ATP synthase subunit I [Thermoplasmata archaeon]|nr:MAG: V-type ATP synthase subunit I [Thermoplasmata archaeon]